MPPDDRRRSPLVGLCIVVAVVVLVRSGTVAATAQDEQHDDGTSDDGQRQGEGQGATESGFPEQGDTPSGEETDAVGGTTMPLIGAFVTGLLVVARRRRGGVEQ